MFILGEKQHFNINLEDEVVRGSIILHKGKLMWPPPPPPAPVTPAVKTPTPEVEKKAEPALPNYFRNTLYDASLLTGGTITLKNYFFIGKILHFAPRNILKNSIPLFLLIKFVIVHLFFVKYMTNFACIYRNE